MSVYTDITKELISVSLKCKAISTRTETSRTTGLSPLAPAAVLLPLPPLVGVTDLEMGVVGFSPSSFFVDGVLAFEDVPLRGL
jgi:hypothetical protein